MLASVSKSISSPDMPYALPMRVLGIFLVLFSIIELGVGGAVYGYLQNVSVGAWWCAMFTLITGFFAISSKNRNMVIAGCVASVISVILTLVGASVDGSAHSVFAGELGCLNTNTFTYTGSSTAKQSAYYCAGVYNYYTYTSADSWQCVCTDNTLCYGYNLVSGNNCGGILLTYTPNLGASTAFCSILCIMVFAYSVLTCCTVCCGPNGVANGMQNNFSYNPAASVTSQAVPVTKTVYANAETIDKDDQAL